MLRFGEGGRPQHVVVTCRAAGDSFEWQHHAAYVSWRRRCSAVAVAGDGAVTNSLAIVATGCYKLSANTLKGNFHALRCNLVGAGDVLEDEAVGPQRGFTGLRVGERTCMQSLALAPAKRD